MNYYDITIPHLIRTLGQVHRWLDKAAEHAAQKKYDVSVILHARLAPDQFAFTRQVQVVTDNAKGIASRLSGEQAPAFEDTEKTVEELRARVDKTVAWLKTLKPEQFAGAAERRITLPFAPNMHMTAEDYLFQFALPNLYFHATTAYSILRHNGIDVGKRDFLGDINMRPN